MLPLRARGLLVTAACLSTLALGCARGEGRSSSPVPDAGSQLPTPGDSSGPVGPHMPGDPATETNVAGIRDAGADSDADAGATP